MRKVLAQGRRPAQLSALDDGYDWNQAAADQLSVGARAQRAMRNRTTFTWYVGGKRVATERVRIRR